MKASLRHAAVPAVVRPLPERLALYLNDVLMGFLALAAAELAVAESLFNLSPGITGWLKVCNGRSLRCSRWSMPRN